MSSGSFYVSLSNFLFLCDQTPVEHRSEFFLLRRFSSRVRGDDVLAGLLQTATNVLCSYFSCSHSTCLNTLKCKNKQKFAAAARILPQRLLPKTYRYAAGNFRLIKHEINRIQHPLSGSRIYSQLLRRVVCWRATTKSTNALSTFPGKSVI